MDAENTTPTDSGAVGRGPWAWDRQRLALIVAASVAVLALVALVAAIDLPENDNDEQERAEQGNGEDQGGEGQGAPGGEGGGGSLDLRPGGGNIDLGNGADLDVREIPGCPGGIALGDDILIIPDPEACGYERVPPGAEGFDPSGKIILVPDVNGDVGGVRIGPDGQLELIEPGEFGDSPGDLGLGFLPDGSVRLSRPDGSFLDIVPGDDGLAFRNPDGSLVLPENNGQSPDSIFEPPGAQAEPDRNDARGDSTDENGDGFSFPRWLLWVLLAIVALGLLALIARGMSSRDGSEDDDDEDEAEDDVQDLVDYSAEIDALDRMLWEIDQEPDPRTAIRRVYAALETGLDNAEMARRQSETPGIYLRRILGRFDVLDAPLRELTELFEQARFSQHEITPQMRDRAVQALVAVRGHYAHAATQSPQPEPAY